jgi:hypothetical protein
MAFQQPWRPKIPAKNFRNCAARKMLARAAPPVDNPVGILLVKRSLALPAAGQDRTHAVT